MPSLIRSTFSVASMTMLSRVLGLLRDIVIARMFSASDAADAFFVAFKIPNFMRRLFAEGAFSAAFVPVLTEYKNTRAMEDTRRFVGQVAGTLGLILLMITLVGVVASPALVTLFAAGFIDQPQKFELTSELLRMTFPYLLLISMTALAGGILNSWKQFAVPAFTPVLLNLSLIGSALWLAPRLEVPVHALGWGVLVAGLAQLLFQLPFLYRLGLLPRPRWAWRDSGVQKIIRLMTPALFGTSVSQINLLFDTFIASFLISGSVSWLYYADRLLEFPLGVFGIALATVVLPNLSESHVSRGRDHFNRVLNWAALLALLIALPATTGLILLAAPILATLFQYGAFTPGDTEYSAMSLMAYALGLPAFILIKILANAFYARQDTRTPVRIGIRAMLANMLMNILFVIGLLKLTQIPGHVGLALATAFSAWLNAALLARALRRDGYLTLGRDFLRQLGRMLLASLGMAMLLLWLQPDPAFWNQSGLWQRILGLAELILPAALCYVALLWIIGFRRRHLSL